MTSELDFKDARTVARRLGLSEDTMIDLLEGGQLPGIKLNKEWLVSERALEEFLRGEQDRQVAARRAEQRVPNGRGAKRKRRRGGRRELEFVLLGTKRRCKTYTDVLVEVIQQLALQDPQFLRRFSEQGGRTRRYVARKPEELYPDRPDLATFSRRIQAGWWVATNYSAKDIESILRKACRIAGLTWGSDLILRRKTPVSDRARALAFVGIAADSARDVARRHDEYFAESLTDDES